MKLIACVLFLAPLWGQISQMHPELCGHPGGINPPLTNMSARVDPDGATLFVGSQGSERTIRLLLGNLPSLISVIAEVCPLPDGRLVAFGDFGAMDVYVVDPAKSSMQDSFTAYWPAMSPNQRWIAYVKFFPLHGVDGSDEYMLYDLAKSPAQNREDRNTNDTLDAGKFIYPPGHENFGGSNIGLPPNEQHFGGRHIYWADDSRAIAFEDRMAPERDPGVALVLVGQDGNTTAFRHALTASEVCGHDVRTPGSNPWMLNRIRIGPDEGRSRSVFLELGSTDLSACPAGVVQLHSDQFEPARTEVHTRPTPTKGAILDGVEVIPPPKKKQ